MIWIIVLFYLIAGLSIFAYLWKKHDSPWDRWSMLYMAVPLVLILPLASPFMLIAHVREIMWRYRYNRYRNKS